MNSAGILLPDSKGKIESLQTVRALAFLGIFTSHVGLSSLGAWGVSVFFVLSGFVMIYTYYNRSLETSFRSCIRFSFGKIRKLYFLHIIMMLAALVLKLPLITRDFSVKRIIFCLGELFLNVTLLQSWVPSYAVYFSLNGVSWYLSVCLLLYAVFPIVLKVVKKMDCKKLIVVMIIVYAIQIIIGFCSRFVSVPMQYFDNFSKWTTYILPLFRLGDFVIGCCLGKIFLNREWNIKKIVANGGELLWLLALYMTQYLFENGGRV